MTAVIKIDKPSQSFTKWNAEEDAELAEQFNTLKLEIDEIAKLHNRTATAITARLLKFNYINANEYPEVHKFMLKSNAKLNDTIKPSGTKISIDAALCEIKSDICIIKQNIQELILLMHTYIK